MSTLRAPLNPINDTMTKKTPTAQNLNRLLMLTGTITALVLNCTVAWGKNDSTIETFYAVINTDTMASHEADLVLALLDSPALDRLKSINQYGPIQIVDSQGHNSESYTRYDHSLGVYYLLNRFGAPFPEQISGLLHDVSHSAFSHVSDYLFSEHSAGDPEYHDSQFVHFANTYGIAPILARYQLSAQTVAPKGNRYFPRLERPLPELAADRLDYLLQGAARRNLLSTGQVETILSDLMFDPPTEHWYVSNVNSARLIGDASIVLNRTIFATAWGRVLYQWAAKAVNELLQSKAISSDDLFYTMGDQELWQVILQNSQSQTLAGQMQTAWYKVREVSSPGTDTVTFENVRCRITDPRVGSATRWQRLSQLDNDYWQRYQQEQQRCRQFYARIEP